MFAVTGTIKAITIEKREKEFAKLIISKKRSETTFPIFFYVFNHELISDFKDEKIIEGDNVEVTFYIKGIDKNGHVVNNLYADRVAVLKRQKAKKDTEQDI